jgi:hypothetical protein
MRILRRMLSCNNCNWSEKKRLEVADSKGEICGGTPTPGVLEKEAAND